ncbi:MAG TPA: SMC family ATPase [Acidimicrobiales bacterium]|nr:SMC family ATPase [Acidimicrobiales bacterium]
MRITRLYLRNYRVFEDELDIEIPPGLVGIYGANGAGKSYLVESILFTLYGYTRTAKDEVRTADVNADCVTEVEFEHEGHLYLVRRTLAGINSAIKAKAMADGAQVAEGVQSVRQYVHSILGMDLAAFRASVFAEQKQVASFSGLRPAERKDLVLKLLGITPLDRARDDSRRDARAATATHDQLRRVLPDLEELGNTAADAEAKAAALAATAASEHTAADTVAGQLQVDEERLRALDELGREHAALLADGRAVRAEHDAAATQAAELEAELEVLAGLDQEVVRLRPLAAGLEDLEAGHRLVEEALRCLEALKGTEVPEAPPAPDEEGVEVVRTAADSAHAAAAEVTGLLQGARAELQRAEEALARSGDLSPEGSCPVCGQALGTAFEQVQAHRAGEQADAVARVTVLEERRTSLEAEATRAGAALADKDSACRSARTAWAAYEKLRDRRSTLEEAAARTCALVGRVPTAEESARQREELVRRRAAAGELQRALGRLERQPAVIAGLEAARSRVGDTSGRLEALRDKVRSLGFDEARLAAARTACHDRRLMADTARATAQAAALLAERAKAEAEAAAKALQTATELHATLVTAADEARHLGRVAELLAAFRDTVVATVGPRLSTHAAELFAELTDGEYDRLEVDPITYEIQIRDGGRLFGMDRFSGSETDLANLALRVAISEHVRLLSGGAVGLLVLDEVFGPLDEDRKVRMLAALERLRARFRQILVVTHDEAIKAELPHALEVLKLPGRRGSARLVNA